MYVQFTSCVYWVDAALAKQTILFLVASQPAFQNSFSEKLHYPWGPKNVISILFAIFILLAKTSLSDTVKDATLIGVSLCVCMSVCVCVCVCVCLLVYLRDNIYEFPFKKIVSVPSLPNITLNLMTNGWYPRDLAKLPLLLQRFLCQVEVPYIC